MFWNRNKVVYIPYETGGGKINEYVVNMIKILQKKYDVCGVLAEPFDLYAVGKTKAVFLNWVEERLDWRIKLQLRVHKLFGVQIIWVFHNKYPHQVREGDKRIIKNMKWLADHADRIMIHSVSSEKHIPNPIHNRRKKVYIPHIMYSKGKGELDREKIRKKYGIGEKTFVFTMFGMIKPYKHYEDGICAFKEIGVKDAKLILAGDGMDAMYTKYLKTLCHRNDDIILDLRYLAKTELYALMEISDVIVIPYKNRTSMNSGVMIQAFSNSKTVIVPDICMGRDFADEDFCYRYKNALSKAMLRAYKNGREVNRKMGERAYDYVARYHNEKAVERQLELMLEKRGGYAEG